MKNESELGFLGRAIEEIKDSSHPNDEHVRNLLYAALALRNGRGDIYPKRSTSLVLAAADEQTVGSQADLRTPEHFRDYFVIRLGEFLSQEVVLPLPSQEHVDQGKRIEDAGFTTYQSVACPELTIVKGYQYPVNWKFQLDPWVYEQIANKNLKPGVLNLGQMYGWLDVSPGLDWKSNDPMFDPNTDKPLVDLLKGFRAKGKRGGIEVVDWCKQFDPGSLYGISADETRNVVYTALAEIFGANKGGVRNLKAAELNFIGNYLYFDSNGEINLGGANSWVWLDEDFGAGDRLVGGRRGYGGLSDVRSDPSDSHDDDIRIRPLVVSPSTA